MNIRYVVTANIFGTHQVICDEHGYENHSMAELLAVEISKSVETVIEHRRCVHTNADGYEVVYAELYEKGKKRSM